MIKFSIIVPTFNSEETILRALESVKRQTYRNYECIVVDDGSTDSTCQLCEAFIGLHDSYRLIRLSTNSGVATARNVGLSAITGDVVVWLDSDDYIESNALEELSNVFKDGTVDIVIYDVVLEGKIKKILQSLEKNSGIIDQSTALEELCKDRSLKSWMTNKAISLELFNNKKFCSSHKIYEDFALLPKLFERSKRIYYLKKPLYHYVENKRSLTRQFKTDLEIIKLNVIRDRVSYFANSERLYQINVHVYLLNLMSTMIRFGQNYNRIQNGERREFKNKLAEILGSDIIKIQDIKGLTYILIYVLCRSRCYRLPYFIYSFCNPIRHLVATFLVKKI